ncbi:T9SS type A sorting domain-containing protein [Bacteroides sp.]
MKKIITLSAGILFTMASFAQTPVINTSYGFFRAGGTEVDLNNDGHLDLIMGGLAREMVSVEDPNGNLVETERGGKILLYDAATKTMVDQGVVITNSDRAQFVTADLDGDGNMDIVMAESANAAGDYGGGLYKGDGNGHITKVTDVKFVDEEGEPAKNFEFFPVAVETADFNNDGKIDIIVLGFRDVNGVVKYCNTILMNKGNWTFEVSTAASDLLEQYKLALVTVKALDYNNDGYMDFFISGNCDNGADSNNGARVLGDLFLNVGADGPGTFYRVGFGADGSNGFFQKANGGMAFADFNNDGLIDILINGEGGEGTGEPVSGDEWVCKTHLYLNTSKGENVSFSERTQTNFVSDIRPLNSTHNSIYVIDWNGNGSYDFFIGGWCVGLPDGGNNTQAAYMLMNDGNGIFSAPTRIPGFSEGCILFADWDGDGAKDYFSMGHSEDPMFFTEANNKRTSALNYNTNQPAARPAAPQNLDASVDGDDMAMVTLSWQPADGAMKNTSYEYFIKDGSGKFYAPCAAFVGGDKDGIRKRNGLGNAMLNNSITLYDLPEGTYTWGVQAINAAYNGSTFATSTFVVGNGGVGIAQNEVSATTITVSGNELAISCEGEATAALYATTGELLASYSFNGKLNKTLSDGIYLVKVISQSGVTSQKVVARK